MESVRNTFFDERQKQCTFLNYTKRKNSQVALSEDANQNILEIKVSYPIENDEIDSFENRNGKFITKNLNQFI